MAAPKPAKKLDELGNQVLALASKADNYRSVSEWTSRELIKSLHGLWDVDRAQADMLEAIVHSLSGRVDAVERCCRNAISLNKREEGLTTMFECYANMGYFQKAAGILPEVLERSSSVGEIMPMIAATAGFRTTVNFIDRANADRRVIAMNAHIPDFKEASHVLDQLGVTDVQLYAALEKAGEVLRSNEQLWKGTRPDLVIHSAGIESLLSIEYPVAVAPETAAAWSWQLTKDLIRADLDLPGVNIGFVGVAKA